MSSAGTKGRRLVVLALALAGSAAQGAEPAPAAGRATLVVAQDSGGDFRGKDERPIIEALGRAPAGGGTILIKPGIYTLRRAIVLRSRRNLTLVGAPGAVLRVSGRCESVVASDAAEGDKELAVEDSSPFVAGAKVEIQAPAPKPGWKIRTVRGVAEGKLLLASPLDFKCPKGTRVVLAANVIELWGCHGITLVNLTLDGSKPERTKVRDHTHQCGVHGSGVRNIRIVNCTVKNAWHRGISFYGPTAVLVAGCTLRNTDAAINFDHHSYWCQAIENEIEGCGGGVELNDTADCIVARKASPAHSRTSATRCSATPSSRPAPPASSPTARATTKSSATPSKAKGPEGNLTASSSAPQPTASNETPWRPCLAMA